MPATVELRSHHGATDDLGVNVAGGSIRFKQADNDTLDAINPIPIPTAPGTNRSWIKQLRLFASVTPDNLIDNLKFYTDGGNGFGTGVGLQAKVSATYLDPITQADTALATTADAFTFTSGAPLAMAGSLANPSTGSFGDFVQLQMTVNETATQGTTPSETLTMAFDES